MYQVLQPIHLCVHCDGCDTCHGRVICAGRVILDRRLASKVKKIRLCRCRQRRIFATRYYLRNVSSLQTLRSFNDIKRHALAFFERAVAAPLNGAEVHEYIFTVLDFDKSEAFLSVKPLDCSLTHKNSSRYSTEHAICSSSSTHPNKQSLLHLLSRKGAEETGSPRQARLPLNILIIR